MLSKNKRVDRDEASPRKRLRTHMQDLVGSNELSATRILDICQDIGSLDTSAFFELRKQKSHKHAARCLRSKWLKKKTTWYDDYLAEVPCWNPRKNEVCNEVVAFHLPHEAVAVLAHYANTEALYSKSGFDPRSLQHLLSVEEKCGAELIGLGLWGDEAPTQWNRETSIAVITMSLPGLDPKTGYARLRVPIVALPVSRCCEETFMTVFEIISWSLECLIMGQWPTARHDRTAFNASDACRQAPTKKLPRAVLVEVRQDWVWAYKIFKLSTHNLLDGICWACNCTPDTVCRVVTIDIVGLHKSFSLRFLSVCGCAALGL